MNRVGVLVAVAGLEERFVKGLAQDLDLYSPEAVCVLTFQEFQAQTAQHRLTSEKMVRDHGCAWREVLLTREPNN